MGLNVRLDERAALDLSDIRRYLVERSPQGAERVRRHIEATIDQLSDFPRLGRATDEPSVRVLPLTRYPYLIFYTIIRDEVVILHVRHGARRPVDPNELIKD